IKTWGKDQTEYVIASLPFGGYVKMLDEREGEVVPHELDRAFNRQNVYKRFAIVLAGPLFNFIFAFFAYWLMLSVGVTGYKPVLGDIESDSVMARAGFVQNEEIIAVNNKPSPIWEVALDGLLTAAINKEKVQILTRYQGGSERTTELDFGALQLGSEPEEIFKKLGLKAWRPVNKPIIGQVEKGSPADHAGLKPDDEVTKLNGKPISDWLELVEYVSARPGQEVQLHILRGTETLLIKAIPGEVVHKDKKIGRLGIIIKEAGKFPEEMKAGYRYPLIEGLPESIEMVWTKSIFALKMIGKLVTGQISLKNLSGPINIAVFAGYSASAGFARFLDFLAIVSISLGIINLLPVPVLDGGHLMFYLVEIVRGKPVSEEVEEYGFRIGLFIVLMMMSIAIINDITRLLGK
ncbi:MAG: RIP metalloprotease RseP, partial [Gammaproteobacteria bacterium]|nr:RIP metalloprotease RseP [Gammaproteobacteria bacterium]